MASPDDRRIVLTGDGGERLAAASRELAGRRVRWRIESETGSREVIGRAVRPSEWLAPDDPHLLVSPGQTNLTNVLAFIAVHLRRREGRVFLMRRRSYEEEPLEWEALGPDPVYVTVECLAEG